MLVLVGLKICVVAVHVSDLTVALNVLLGFRWFEAMEQKPSYLGTKSDFYTHVHDLPPQLGGESSLSDCSQSNRTTNIMLLLSLASCHWFQMLYLSTLVYVRAQSFCHLLRSGSAHVRGQGWSGAASVLSSIHGCLHHAHASYLSPGISASVHVKLCLHDGPVVPCRMCVSASS